MSKEKSLLARQIVKYRERKDKLADEVKANNKALAEASNKLVEIMDEDGETQFKNSFGTFYQSTDFFVQIVDKDLVHGWLKKHRFFGKLAKIDINPQTLKAWIKERNAEQKSIPPTEGMNAFYKTSVRFKKG